MTGSTVRAAVVLTTLVCATALAITDKITEATVVALFTLVLGYAFGKAETTVQAVRSRFREGTQQGSA